ncbi:protein FAR1-RELATED SEQUENCE 1-like [Camellia sinensis]|uniref:protein FAR1-RELATED SEQUENCE 1-like n=1 Tax=Camellia sinensis TaxID=4442 RepID=UPI0010355FFB|nr:protein FAR1-RELATED SEQUENCE 1-like [Camellia sinensis]
MSTTQRSESMHAFFDRYINAKTTLKQFVEQYENALAKKMENESNEEFNSFNSYITWITQFPLEKQFQKAYTIAKFKEFQQEVVGKIYCYLSPCKECEDGVIIYRVGEDIPIGEILQRATFTVYFKEDSNEANCNCQLFEFRGILCRHQIVVFMERGINHILEKYILKRWNKNVKRCHVKVRISYDNCSLKAEAHRYDKKKFNVFSEVADLATECEEKCDTAAVVDVASIEHLQTQAIVKKELVVALSNQTKAMDSKNNLTLVVVSIDEVRLRVSMNLLIGDVLDNLLEVEAIATEGREMKVAEVILVDDDDETKAIIIIDDISKVELWRFEAEL